VATDRLQEALMNTSGRPLAYFITFSCYGTWLHGATPGSVDRRHNEYGSPLLPPDGPRRHQRQASLTQTPYALDASWRKVVLQTVRDVCAYRSWRLLAAHVRTNHVHVVVAATVAPARIMNDPKVYASRNLNQAGFDDPRRQRWTRHGSTRYLWTEEHVTATVRYVMEEQGEVMEAYREDAAPPL